MKWFDSIRGAMRVAVILLVLVTISFLIYRELSQIGETEVAYVTAPVVRDRLKDSVTSSGTVNALVTVEVGSQLSGQIAYLFADFNDEVAKGDQLAVLDQKSYQARLSESEAALNMAKAAVLIKRAEVRRAREDRRKVGANKEILEARLESALADFAAAKADLDRKKQLRSSGTVTDSTLDQVRALYRSTAAGVREAEANLAGHKIDLAAAEADLEREKAELENALARIPEKDALLELAKVEFDRTTIRSPIDGVVIKRNVDEGQTVAASLEAPTLFTIAQDLSELEVHARVDETDIGKIAIGQRASFVVDAFPQKRFEGEVIQIRKSPEVVQNVVTYTVVIRTKNQDLLLLPGMTALIEIIVMESAEQLLLPTEALLYAPSGAAKGSRSETIQVWKVVDGRPESVEVQVGPSDASYTALEGDALREGDEVVVKEVQRQPSRDIFGIRLGL